MRRNRLQSHNKVSQEAGGVAIRFVQRQPGGGPFVGGEPCADERGFAKASRGSDKRQFAVQSFVQPLDEAGTGDSFGAMNSRSTSAK